MLACWVMKITSLKKIKGTAVRLSYKKLGLWHHDSSYPKANEVNVHNLEITRKNYNLISYLGAFGYTLTQQDSELH